jgi:mannosyltransferase
MRDLASRAMRHEVRRAPSDKARGGRGTRSPALDSGDVRIARATSETIALSAVAGATAVVLGAISIERRSLWLDEAFDIGWSQLSWSDYIRVAFEREGSQALYLLLLKPWLALTSTDEWVARAPSVFAAGLAAALLVPLGIRLFGSRLAGIGAGLLLATNAFSVAWSQQARQYALAMLFAVVVTYLFVVAVESEGWRWWLAYGAVAGLSVYSHFFVALVLASHVPALLVTRRAGVQRRWAVAAGIAFVIALPALNFVLNHDAGQVSWIPELDYDYVDDVVYQLSGESRLALAVGAAGLLALCFDGVRIPSQSWRHLLVGSWLVVPLGLALVISHFKPMLVDRYLIVCIPALALAMSYAVSRLGRWAGSAALICLLFVAMSHVRDWYGSLIAEDWRGAVQYVEREKAPTHQLLVYPGFLAAPVDYYATGPIDTGERFTTDPAWIITVADRAPEIEEWVTRSGYEIADRANFINVDVWRVEKVD